MVWSRFTKFSETETIFVLFAPPRFLFTIPKRAIPAEKIGELRSMLVQKLGIDNPSEFQASLYNVS